MSVAQVVRTASVVAAIALVSAIAVPLPAASAPGDDVLVFSNGSVVDTSSGAEYDQISAAITAAGFDVTPFDGGDGSALAWTTALTDIEVFVLPEQEPGQFYTPGSPSAWLSEAAKDALIDWVQAGGTMLQSAACGGADITILSEATGLDFSDSVDHCSAIDPSPRWISDAALPASLDTPSATDSFDLGDMTEAQLDLTTVWYASDTCGDYMSAGVFTVESGGFAFLGWDYFPAGNDATSWNAVLAAMIDGNPAASTWAPPVPPAPKDPITTTTSAGETLYTVSESDPCDDLIQQFFRVDPGTALAAPVGDNEIFGDASQGAWDPITETAFFPFYNDDEGEYFLMTVDPTTGAFTEVGEFTIDDLDYFEEVFSIAIGPDGSAYLMAELEIDGTYYGLALFSLDLTDASLTFIASIDDDLLDEPNGFAVDPTTGLFYAFEEDTRELFQVNVTTGALTLLGVLDAPSVDLSGSSSDVTALQIGADGTFWVVFDEADASFEDAGMLATFTLADISGGVISATEVGIITDGPIPSWSLLLVPGAPELAATGPAADGLLTGSVLLLLLGGVLVGFRTLRRRAQTA